MKNFRIFLTIFLIGLSLTGFSQSMNAKLILGFNGAQIDGDGLAGYKKFGVVGGASVSFPLKKEKWTFEQEIVFSQKGSREGSNAIAFKYTLNYLEGNSLFNYNYSEKIYFGGGIKIGYLLSAKLDKGFGNEDVKEKFIVIDPTYVIGLGYNVNKKFTLSTQFSRSVFNVNFNDSFYNNTVRFAVGWKFNSQAEN